MTLKSYTAGEIKHHLMWMRDNTNINPFAIMNAWEQWERRTYPIDEITTWIDYILQENEITPPWEMKKKFNFGGLWK